MTGYEWPDGQEPVVQPNTMYWLHFQRDDGGAIYCYASESNPYPQGYSSSSSGVDFYSAIYALTQEVNLITGTIAGTVTDTGGNPLSGATVTRNPGGVSVTTQPDGTYMMNSVPVGSHDVTASGMVAGKVMVNVVPTSGVLWTSIVPPCRLRMP